MFKALLRAIVQLEIVACLLVILSLWLASVKPPDQWIPLTFITHTSKDLFLLDVPRRLAARLTRDEANQDAPALSPDGKWIAYTLWTTNVSFIKVMSIYGEDAPFLQSVATVGAFPAWSPDGQQIVFASFGSPAHIYIRDLNAIEIRQLTPTSTGETRPTWSPDGKWIVYVASQVGDPASLVAIPGSCPASCNSLAQQLTGTAAHELFPAWSPNGKWIAYIADQNNRRDIDLLDTTCLQEETDCLQQPQQLLAHVSFSTTQLSWTQDSQQVIFHAEHNGFPAIYAVDITCASIQGGCRPTLWTTLLER